MKRHHLFVALLAFWSAQVALLGCTPSTNQSAGSSASENVTLTAAEVVSVDVAAGVIVLNAGQLETLAVTSDTNFSPAGATLASFQPHTKILFAYKVDQGKKVATQLVTNGPVVAPAQSAPDASTGALPVP